MGGTLVFMQAIAALSLLRAEFLAAIGAAPVAVFHFVLTGQLNTCRMGV
jgi:uncharacterized membrane protein